MKQNQSGFGVLVIVVIILVVAVIGLAGWKFMRGMHKDEATTTTTTTTTNNAKSDTSKTTEATNQGATKYLTIKEWGVKFALTTDTADAYYDTATSSSLDSMSLRVHSLDSESDCKNGKLSLAGIFRVPKDAMDDMLPGKKYSETRDGKTVGDYFYFISGSQYMCTEAPDKQVTLQAVRNSFNTAGPTIQKN
jgi:Tfp pilus assembly protein PilV